MIGGVASHTKPLIDGPVRVAVSSTDVFNDGSVLDTESEGYF